MKGAIRANKKITKPLRQCKRKIRHRLDKRILPEHLGPMLHPGHIHYEISDPLTTGDFCRRFAAEAIIPWRSHSRIRGSRCTFVIAAAIA